MAQQNTQGPLNAVLGIFNKLSMQQKIILGSLTALTFVILGVIFFLMNEPSYSTLFSNLNAEDAQKTIEYLTAQKIPYKLEDNGQSIKITKEKLYETRISLSAKGIPSTGVVGYELFDQNNLGMSEFHQKLNFKRAIEGELTKTIQEIQGVEQAKVQIVMPEKNVFKEEEKPTTASVVVKMKMGASLNKTNVMAIINLVSHSVEGLDATNVAVLDTRGRLLSKDFNENDPLVAASTKQYEVKTQIENYLSQKAQTMLDNVLGVGNSYVTVNADLNFDQVEKQMKTYDPESQVAISEQKQNQEKNDSQSGNSTNSQTSSTTNYNINERVEKIVQATGAIHRLTVAAVVNQNLENNKPTNQTPGQPVKKQAPIDFDQLKNELQQIVSQSVGVDTARKDEIKLSVLPFLGTEEQPQETTSPILKDVDKWGNFALIIVGVIASMLLLRSLLNKLKNEKVVVGKVESKDGTEVFIPLQQNQEGQVLLPSGGPISTMKLGKDAERKQLQTRKKKELLAASGEDIEEEITEDAFVREANLNKIRMYVSKNPAEAAKLIHAWLSDDEGY